MMPCWSKTLGKLLSKYDYIHVTKNRDELNLRDFFKSESITGRNWLTHFWTATFLKWNLFSRYKVVLCNSILVLCRDRGEILFSLVRKKRNHGLVENASEIDASVPVFDSRYNQKKCLFPLHISLVCVYYTWLVICNCGELWFGNEIFLVEHTFDYPGIWISQGRYWISPWGLLIIDPSWKSLKCILKD
jgi:hypothetical protein